MENKVDIREIAQYCKNEYEQECEKSECKGAYSIVYAAVTSEGRIKVSTTPHVLVDAERCYLIHSWVQRAVSCWYDTYAIQSINADGEEVDATIDDIVQHLRDNNYFVMEESGYYVVLAPSKGHKLSNNSKTNRRLAVWSVQK